MKHVSLLAAALALATGCRGDSIEVGHIDTDGPVDDSTSTESSATGSATSGSDGSETTESSEDGGSSSSSSPSTSGGPTACGGAEATVCLPGDASICFCPGEVLTMQSAWIVDLDADGHDDILGHATGVDLPDAIYPYVTTPDGLVAHAPANARDHFRGIWTDGAGTIRGFGIETIVTYALDAGFTSTPMTADTLPPDSNGTRQLGDFDADGTMDVGSAWILEGDSAGVWVVFDVLGPAPTTWTHPLPTDEFVGQVQTSRCDLDGDGADDLIVRTFIENPEVFWGEPGSPTVTPETLPHSFEGTPLCQDLDDDGDRDLFIPFACHDCTGPFGGFSVLEQTAPRVFELAELAPDFGNPYWGGTSLPARLVDASERMVLSIGGGGQLGVPSPGSNLGIYRRLGPLAWDDGTYGLVEDVWVRLEEVVDVDHDGVDEFLVRREIDDGIERTQEVRLYARE